MTSKNHQKAIEPFLNSVARRIGRAAGSFSKVAHDLTQKVEVSTMRVTASAPARAAQGKRVSPKRKAATVAPIARPTRRSAKKADPTQGPSQAVAGRKKSSLGKMKPKRSTGPKS